jgi:hypothetical protein
MGTIMDYLEWRGDLRFSQYPFNDIDAMILAMLTYLPLNGIVPATGSNKKISFSEVADHFSSKSGSKTKKIPKINTSVSAAMDSDLVELFLAAAHSERFNTIQLSRFEAKTDFAAGEQFAAVTFTLPGIKREKVIAFRGTDNTLIGWKEDMEMAYMEQIPAHESACRYLKRSMDILPGKVTVCGHSKGGNLAVYAGSRMKQINQAKLSRIINFDGPGFSFSLVPRASFTHCEHKVVNYIPEESVVGVMLEQVGKRHVVASTAHSIYQHYALTWKVAGAKFIEGSLSNTAKLLEDTLETWLKELSLEKRKTFTDALFDILGASEGKTVDPVDHLKDINQIIKNYSQLDESTKKLLSEVISSLTAQATGVLTKSLKDKLPKIG